MLLCVKRRLEWALTSILLKIDFFGCAILAELWLVKIFRNVFLLITQVLRARAQLFLNELPILGSVLLLNRVNHFIMCDISILIFDEPVIEYPYWYILIISPWLERALFQFLFFILLPNLLDLHALISGTLMQPCTILDMWKSVTFLWADIFISLWRQLWLEGLFLFKLWSIFGSALFPSKLSLVHFLIVEYFVEVLNQLLLAPDSIYFASWYHIENVINIATIWMLILTHSRFIVNITIADHTIALKGRCVWHYYQVVQIHQEAQEVEEWLGEDFSWVITLGSMQEVPNILDGRRLCLQLLLIECLDEAQTVQYFREVVHWNCLNDISW